MPPAGSLPGSAGLPVIGETPSFLHDALTFVETRIRTYGRLFRTHLLTRPTIISASYEHSLALLQATLDAAPAYRQFLHPLYPRPNLLTSSTGTQAYSVAKRFTAALGKDQVPMYQPVIDEIVQRHVGQLVHRAKVARDEGVSIKPYAFFKQVAERVITTIVLGQLPENVYETVRGLCSNHFNGVVAAPVSVSVFGRRTARSRAEESYKRLSRILKKLVREGMDKKSKGREWQREEPRCVLDWLVRQGEGDVEEMVEFLMLVLSTAIPKCIASCVASVLHESGRAEGTMRAVCSQDEREIGCALMETLRMHPPLLGGMRAGDVDGGSVGATSEIGEGWRFWYSIRHCNRDEGVYERGEEFVMGRWRNAMGDDGCCPFARPGEEKGGVCRSVLSFGGGERHCPGRDVAWVVMMGIVKGFFGGVRVGRVGKGSEGMRFFPVLRVVKEGEVRVFCRRGEDDG